MHPQIYRRNFKKNNGQTLKHTQYIQHIHKWRKRKFYRLRNLAYKNKFNSSLITKNQSAIFIFMTDSSHAKCTHSKYSTSNSNYYTPFAIIFQPMKSFNHLLIDFKSCMISTVVWRLYL